MSFSYGPDYSSDSEDSLLCDDGDYEEFKLKIKSHNFPNKSRELSAAEIQQQQKNAFLDAISNGNCDKIDEFITGNEFDINADLNDGWTAIMLATSSGYPEMCKKLLKLGAKISEKRDGLTPLMMACNCPYYTTSYENSFEIVKLLVENGAEVRELNRKRMNALMYAACAGNLLSVKFLLPLSDAQAQDNQQWTALTWAVSNNQAEVVKYLSENGFDINLIDIRGNSPLDIARMNGLEDIINLFPKKEFNLVLDILSRCTLDFEQNYENLEKGQMPDFFEDLANILISVKCDQLIPLFYDNRIKLEELLTITDEDLIKLGVNFAYQRKRILMGIYRFHRQPYHPKSLHISYKQPTNSNADVAIQIESAIKQLISMESSLKYLLKNSSGKKFYSKNDDKVIQNIETIKRKILQLENVALNLNQKLETWDSIAAIPVDLITSKSTQQIKRKHFLPWTKFGFFFITLTIVVYMRKRAVLNN